MNWKPWLHGLGAAVIGGAASTITVMIIDPTTFNVHQLGKVAAVAGVSAILNAAAYLKQSPLPG